MINLTSNHRYQPLSQPPLAITVVCLLGFIGAILSVPMAFSDTAKNIGSWFPPYAGVVSMISLICMIGLWFTRQWAMYSYIGLVMVNQIVLVATGNWYLILLFAHLVIVATILVVLDDYSKSLARQALRYLKRQVWAIVVAYMVGIHNFYKQENKTPEDIVIKIEDVEEQEDSSPKD